MDAQAFAPFWDQIRQKYGIYLRLLEAIPADRFDTRPVPGMRTPTEMVVHTSGSIVRDIAQGVAKGRITAEEAGEEGVAATLGGKAETLDFARACWAQAAAAVGRIGDEELSAIVDTPWDMTFPGWVGFGILNDELLHHRGQLYAYVRACGAEPPFMWGFADNPEGFGPA